MQSNLVTRSRDNRMDCKALIIEVIDSVLTNFSLLEAAADCNVSEQFVATVAIDNLKRVRNVGWELKDD